MGALDGLYKSTDNGINFKKISDLRQINNLAFSSSGSIYIASDNGLYKSTDGTAFTKISELGNYIHTVNIASNGDIYVGKNDNYSSKIYKSTDGTTFTKISELGNDWVFAIAIAKNNLYVGYKKGLYVLTDNGINFKKISDLSTYSIFLVKIVFFC